MKLYYTPNSPYARIARVALRESGLRSRVDEFEATTRDAGSGYFDVTPLAKVPYLKDGAARFSNSRDICAHFDVLEGRDRWLPPEDDDARFLRHVVTGFLDGVAVWLRENVRPEGQKSAPVMAYEVARARRVLEWLEPRWQGEGRWDFTALTLACAIDIGLRRQMDNKWAGVAPGVVGWARARAGCPFMQETAPGPP
ncbi:glutathione S-transferase family protein [Alisedimentitalea sp. MJ-SS2]|uniref:glutathione S-transferase family protein n=1 Tax=Aliisedimentitalea sp. MJ-SS2 TaxID=3049795 RepID=UPI002906E399|nr:glutathione S-transferase family protein [Alisedimentitalea sp. MJ-SS2]MDU8929282.1 glutathione S-transferase family protein [Alisedimentitalea sp. MJ-SS2]